jgi:putative glutamine amidotransferase
MRLVSVMYEDVYPFNFFKSIKSWVSSKNPADLKQGDVLLVWGGADIYSGYYNKKTSKMGHSYDAPSYRDAIEWGMMNQAKQLGIPIIGVCRGAQMLCALAGGYLIQHINGHGGNHSVITNDGREYKTNSIHHQMMVPGKAKHEVIAQIPPNALLSNVYWDEDNKVDHHQEPEFIYFNDVKGFAIQWHPEMMSVHCDATKHIQEVFEEKLCLSVV